MDRRVPPGSREILPGVTLVVSTMDGYSVVRDGDYLGWIHASIGDQWNAYARRPGTSGDLLGRYAQDVAVKVIVTAWDTGAALPNREPLPQLSGGTSSLAVHDLRSAG